MWGIDSPLLAICMSSGADNLPLRENADLIPSRAVAAAPAAALLWLTVQAQGGKGRLRNRAVPRLLRRNVNGHRQPCAPRGELVRWLPASRPGPAPGPHPHPWAQPSELFLDPALPP